MRNATVRRSWLGRVATVGLHGNFELGTTKNRHRCGAGGCEAPRMARLAGDAGVGTVWGVPTVSESSLPAMPVALDREGSPETPMNHTECGRCGAEFGGITPLLEHYQEVHGGVPKPRFLRPEEMIKRTDGLSLIGACNESRCYPNGAEITDSLEHSSAVRYLSKPPSLSSVFGDLSNHDWHEGRAS